MRIFQIVLFCFTSRSRHPRSTRDWSSDVCSSDLLALLLARLAHELEWSDRREYALTLCQRAIGLARTTNNVGALISALWMEHVLNWGPANVEKRLATANEIAELASRAGHAGWGLRAREIRLSALLELGDTAAVDAEIEAANDLRTAAGYAFTAIEH